MFYWRRYVGAWRHADHPIMYPSGADNADGRNVMCLHCVAGQCTIVQRAYQLNAFGGGPTFIFFRTFLRIARALARALVTRRQQQTATTTTRASAIFGVFPLLFFFSLVTASRRHPQSPWPLRPRSPRIVPHSRADSRFSCCAARRRMRARNRRRNHPKVRSSVSLQRLRFRAYRVLFPSSTISSAPPLAAAAVWKRYTHMHIIIIIINARAGVFKTYRYFCSQCYHVVYERVLSNKSRFVFLMMSSSYELDRRVAIEKCTLRLEVDKRNK